MDIHLAIETNFILGMAKGQDPQAADLLAITGSDLPILLPAICVMEAWVAYEKYFDDLKEFVKSIDKNITQVRRNFGSQPAQALLSSLEQTLQLQFKHNNEEDRNFRAALKVVVERCTLIASKEAVADGLLNERIRANRDNAILAEVLIYAQQLPQIETVFLSANSRDFMAPARVAGLRYFSKTGDFLAWFNSRKSDVSKE